MFLGPLFFISYEFVRKMVDLGTPSKSSGVQDGTNNPPSVAKVVPRKLLGSPKLPMWNNLAPRTPTEAPWVYFSWLMKNIGSFQGYFERFSMYLGISSSIKFWHSPKAPDARNNAEHLQRSCKKLLKKRTIKKLAENLQRTSMKPIRNPKNLQRTSKKPATQISKS